MIEPKKEIGFYQHWEEQRKLFDSIRRQINRQKQKEKEKDFKPTYSLQETIDDIINDMRR